MNSWDRTVGGHGEEQTQQLCRGYERHEQNQMTQVRAGVAMAKQERIDAMRRDMKGREHKRLSRAKGYAHERR